MPENIVDASIMRCAAPLHDLISTPWINHLFSSSSAQTSCDSGDNYTLSTASTGRVEESEIPRRRQYAIPAAVLHAEHCCVAAESIAKKKCDACNTLCGIRAFKCPFCSQPFYSEVRWLQLVHSSRCLWISPYLACSHCSIVRALLSRCSCCIQ